MKRVDRNCRVFESSAYKKDKYKFSLVSQNLTSKDVLLYSDEENYLLCRGAENLPTWVWTKDNLPKEKVAEVEQAMEYYLTGKEKDKFTCKKELYESLLERNFKYLNKDVYFEMGFLYCEEVKKPRETDGYMDKPHLDELDLLADYWYQSVLEMGLEVKTKEEAYEEMKEMVNSDTFHVWRNSEGKLVCMVDYKKTGELVKLSHVYTPPFERRKGYAANLVHDLTKYLLDLGLVPLLYTDYHYPASNKAYQNAGYVADGVLVNFSCSKVKMKTL